MNRYFLDGFEKTALTLGKILRSAAGEADTGVADVLKNLEVKPGTGLHDKVQAAVHNVRSERKNMAQFRKAQDKARDWMKQRAERKAS